MVWVIGVDVGGTFTDFHAFDDETGVVHVHKTPSTPDDPARAVLAGLSRLAADNEIELGQLRRLSHGTTVATNALIQGNGGGIALVTTAGFRDLLEIGRQIRPHMFDFQKDYPAPLVPRELRFEAGERVLADGSVHIALDEAEIERVVEAVRGAKAVACAICFLFAFVNPAHERRLRDALARALPELEISLSSEVQPEFREYERLSTTVLNAYLQPVMSRYMGAFERGLAELAPEAGLGINQSAGGLMSPARARELPIRTALSGPAAGAVGAIHAAGLAGEADVITLDMGGTSADVCLIRGGRAELTFERWIAGYPARIASLDINSVGAGGGSIAWFDRDGLMKVGPASAGAMPGPACYGQGGAEPTVTDANLVLGRLSPAGLLGGGMALDVEAARGALAPAAERLELSIERTAEGIIAIVVANMIRALRAISVERGHDPREFVLLPFGGAGGLHASDVARALGVARFVVPPVPGILCAKGLVVSDSTESFVVSSLTPLGPETEGRIAAVLADLAVPAEDWFAREAVAREARVIQVTLDMRYVGQNYELQVDIDDDDAREPTVEALSKRFFAQHEQSYGYHNAQDPIEIVNYRLRALGRLRRPPEPPVAAAADPAPPLAARRPVTFAAGGTIETAQIERDQLHPGHRIEGPAVIEQLDATTLLHPGDRLVVDGNLNLIVEVGA